MASGRIRGRTPRLESEIDQRKMVRLVAAMALLFQRPISAKNLAERLECSKRTAHRLLNTIEAAGLAIECNMDFEYFLIKYDSCPLCRTKDKVEEMRSGDA